MGKVVSLRLDEVLWGRCRAEAERLGQSYTVFVGRALEQALAGGEGGGSPAAVRPRGGRSVEPASARASEPRARSEAEEFARPPVKPPVDEDLPVVPLPRIAGRHWAQ